jgi:hypothetical protein
MVAYSIGGTGKPRSIARENREDHCAGIGDAACIAGGRGGAREGAGRPTGALNKLPRPVKELAASYGPAPIARLVQLRDGVESEQVRFAAAKELLDRAYGRKLSWAATSPLR